VTIGASGASAVSQPGVSVGPDVVVGEANGYVDLPISLSRPGTLPVTVTYTTSDGTASQSPGNPHYEYSPTGGSATFTPGQTTKVVRVELENNTTVKVEQFFTFNLTGNAIHATITRTTQTVSIKPST
jgi:Calx-beta domain